ncbi:MAG: hypothetical protein E7630_00740 [Ruminococcaceae bacterium]|nr:hypothetical protein [Oscillospiraceae bacterium]
MNLRKEKKQAEARVGRRGGQNRPLTPPKLKLLVTVVNRQKVELYLGLLQGFDVNMQLSMAAQGTANTEMMEMLGLTDRDKAVIFSIIREDRADEALRYLDEKFHTIKNGKGLAFTVPMTGVIGVAIYQFLSNYEG